VTISKQHSKISDDVNDDETVETAVRSGALAVGGCAVTFGTEEGIGPTERCPSRSGLSSLY